MNAQEQFDEDYQYMRQLLVHGGCKVADAKLWLIERATRAEKNLLREKMLGVPKRMGKRTERDIDIMHELMEEDEKNE